MISSKKLLLAAIYAVAGVAVFLYFFQSDTAVIKKNFRQLAEDLEKEGVENNLISAAKARRIANSVTENCRVNIPAYDMSKNISRDQVQPNVMMARSRYQSIAVDFYDFDISFPSSDLAKVIVTVSLLASTPTGETVREIHELMFFFKDVDDDWLITEIEAVDVLER